MPWKSWPLNAAYLLAALAVLPVLVYRAIVHGKYHSGWSEKLFGRLPQRHSRQPCVWFHAVSVGEVLLLTTIIEGLRKRTPHVEFVISTTTSTGHDVARRTFPRDTVCYFPLDFSWSAATALNRVKPTAVVFVELELWPNFVLAAARAGVPLLLINGRLSERSFRGYRRIRPLIKSVLGCFDALAVQNETYAARLAELGGPRERITVTGSVKFDGVETDRNNENTRALRRAFDLGGSETVFVAGSTHPPEEELVLECYRSLAGRHPELRLILVPRHRERFDEVARLIERRGFRLVRRSRTIGGIRATSAQASQTGRADSPAGSGAKPVLLLDTLGELAACWGLADIAFVGGSLTDRGGQNMIEPAAYGAAVLFGPNTRNFRDVVELLLSRQAARVVRDVSGLTAEVGRLLDDAPNARDQGQTAQSVVEAQRGAAARTVDLIVSVVGSSHETGSNRPRRAA